MGPCTGAIVGHSVGARDAPWRAILAGAKVLAVRRVDMPDGAPVAAILR
jgi:hypothetical protein